VADVNVASADAQAVLFTGLELTTDGKIVGVVQVDGDCFVFRLEGNGSPDATFGSAGVARIDANGYCNAISIDAMGRALVSSTNLADAQLWRLTPEGVLDESFGPGGRAVVDFGTSNDRFVEALSRPDGSIVALGLRDANGSTPGTLLSFFDEAGQSSGSPVELVAGTDRNVGIDLVQQADETLLVLILGQNEMRAHLAKVDAEGTLVSTFGEAGWARSMPGSAGSLIGFQPGADGVEQAWGATTSSQLVNFDMDGNPGGFVSEAMTVTQSVGVQCDGKVLAAGTGATGDYAALLRSLEDGTLDESFGVAGTVEWTAQSSSPFASHLISVVIQGDGKIVVAGLRDRAPFVARVWP
jgi:uncharacterized delta-60 repeat protein